MKSLKPTRNFPRSWDSEIEMSKLPDSKGARKKKYVRGRMPLGKFSVATHWICREGPANAEKKGVKKFPKTCRAFDPTSERFFKTDEVARFLRRLLKKHHIKTKCEEINPSEIWVTANASFKDVYKIICTNNASGGTRVNPYMISYRDPDNGKGIVVVVSGCPADDELGEKCGRKFYVNVIDRQKQQKGDPDYVNKYLFPISLLNKFQEISDVFNGMDISDPKEGVDVQLSYDSSNAGADMYGAQHIDKTQIGRAHV